MKRLIDKTWSWVKPYLTPKMIPIILVIWLCTNGVWYAIAFAPFDFIPLWLATFAKGYLALLWMPFSIEKPIIIALAIFIYRFVYNEKFQKIEKELDTDDKRISN